MTEKVDKLDVLQICNKLKVNKNTRGYIAHKYKNSTKTEKQWLTSLKKDGLKI